jgi:hypothetical protein
VRKIAMVVALVAVLLACGASAVRLTITRRGSMRVYGGQGNTRG